VDVFVERFKVCLFGEIPFFGLERAFKDFLLGRVDSSSDELELSSSLVSDSESPLEQTAVDVFVGRFKVCFFGEIPFFGLELPAFKDFLLGRVDSSTDEYDNSSSLVTALRSVTDGATFLPLLDLIEEARRIFFGSPSELELLDK